MILGAGRGQVPIIERAKARGLETVVASIPGDYPGFKVADRVCEIDVRDMEGVLRAASREKIEGIVADQIDIGVPTAAFVADAMGLPGIGYEVACRFTDKYLMRDACRALGVNVPRFEKAASVAEAHTAAEEIGLPVVIKPVDSAGSKGVSLVRLLTDIDRSFSDAMRHSRQGQTIVERYVDGDEFLVEGFTSGSRLTNLAIAERLDFDIPNLFIPRETVYRPATGDLEQQVLEVNRRVVEGFGLRFGVTHGEYLVEKSTGRVYLVEIAARGGGNYISSDLIPLATGINVNDALLDLVMGIKPHVELNEVARRVCGFLCFSLPVGVVTQVAGIDEIRSMPGVHKAFLDTMHVGLRTRPMTDKSLRMGPILIRAESLADYRAIVAGIRNVLRVTVETSHGPAGITW